MGRLFDILSGPGTALDGRGGRLYQLLSEDQLMAKPLPASVEPLKIEGREVPFTYKGITSILPKEAPKREVSLRPAPEVAETPLTKFTKLFEATPEERIGRAQAYRAVQERLKLTPAEEQYLSPMAKEKLRKQREGIPLSDIEKDFGNLIRSPYVREMTGIAPAPRAKEIVSALVTPAVVVGAVVHPIQTTLMVGAFSLLDKVVDLNKFVPSDASDEVKSAVEMIDFIGKMILAGKITRGIVKRTPAVFETFTKDKLTQYKLPETIPLSSAQVKDVYRTGLLTTAEQKSLLRGLGLNNAQLKESIRTGVSINVPASRLVTITDKPYWAKIKGIFGGEPYIKATTTLAKPPTGLVSEYGITGKRLAGPVAGAIEAPPAPSPISEMMPTVAKARVPAIPTAKPEVKPLSAEDMELKPEKFAKWKIAIRDNNGKVYSSKYGENGIYNHYDLEVKNKLKNTDIKDTGFINPKGEYVTVLPEEEYAKPTTIKPTYPEVTVPPSLSPLAEEARKYKTAEEFKNAIQRISKREGELTKAEEKLRSQIVTTAMGKSPLLEAYNKQFGDFNKTYIDFYNQVKGEVPPPPKPPAPSPISEMVAKAEVPPVKPTMPPAKPEVVGGMRHDKLAISDSAKKFLDDWTWTKNKAILTPEIEKELSKYKPTESVLLYRAEEIGTQKPLQSWTYEKGFAETIVDENPNKYKLISKKVNPEDILVDFTKLPNAEDYINEVIVKEPSPIGKIMEEIKPKRLEQAIERIYKNIEVSEMKRTQPKRIKALAGAMYREYKDVMVEAGPTIRQQIKSMGGIRPHNLANPEEEWRELPPEVRNIKSSASGDDRALSLGMTENELYERLKGEKITGRESYKSFMQEAEHLVTESEGKLEYKRPMPKERLKALVVSAQDRVRVEAEKAGYRLGEKAGKLTEAERWKEIIAGRRIKERLGESLGKLFGDISKIQVSPDTSPEVVRVVEALKEAKPLRVETERIYTQERAKRIAEVEKFINEQIDQVGGEEGYSIILSKLKGQLIEAEAKPKFEPIKDKLTPEEIKALFNRTWKHPYLDNWEKINAATGLIELITGDVPQPKKLVLLEEVYGSDLIKAILLKRALGVKVGELILDIANIPRMFLATGDMSGFLRQGVVYVASHPVIAGKAMGKTFQFAFSPKAFRQYFLDLPKDPLYPLMRKARLAITDPSRIAGGLAGREEPFTSTLIQKIPILGEIPKFAERSWTGFLNKLRVDIFKNWATELMSKGLSPVSDIDTFKSAANVVNTFSGRGGGGKLERIGPHLSAVFFSPRLNYARFNALNIIWYAKQPPIIRKRALGDFAKFVGAGLTLLGLIVAWKKANNISDEDLKVESDPRSSDWGKIKIKNTRFDIWAGFQQWARTFAQVASGQRKNTTTGEIVSLTKDEYPFTTRKEVLLRFVEGKMAPAPALINELISGAKTFEGEDLSFETVVKEKFVFMYIQDIADAYKDAGLEMAFPAGTAAFFGVGVQTYLPKQRKAKGPSLRIRGYSQSQRLPISGIPVGTQKGGRLYQIYHQKGD